MRLISTSIQWTQHNGSQQSSVQAQVVQYLEVSSTILLAIFTVFANLITVVLLIRHRPMQKSISNLYILSLSVADMLIGCLVMCYMIVHQLFESKPWPFYTQWMCDLWQISDIVLSTISLLSICAIALDRVWNLEKPLRVFKRSRRLARKLIILVWLLPLILWVPFYFMNVWIVESGCSFEYRNPVAVIPVAVLLLYVPAIVLVVMFIRISFVVHGHLSFLRAHSNNPLGVSPLLPDRMSSQKISRDATPNRTPEANKKISDASTYSNTSGYNTMRSPRSTSPRLAKPEFNLAPLSEERSSGRERSASEQISGKIVGFEVRFDVDSNQHLRVKGVASAPTRRESLQKKTTWKHSLPPPSRKHPSTTYGSRSTSFSRRLSTLSRSSSRRFSVIAIPSNLADILQREGVSQQVRAAKAVALILCCFLICWSPFLLLWPAKVYWNAAIPDWLYLTSIWLHYLCSALNPLLYTLSSPRVRTLLSSHFTVFCSNTKLRVRGSTFRSGTMV